jgi:sphinganine-1-phosphate aldolase
MLNYLGEEGFLGLAKAARSATLQMMEGINSIPGLFVLGNPPATVFSFGSKTINVYQLAVKLKEKGWRLHAQHHPASLHMTVSPHHQKIVQSFLQDLRETAKELLEAGPAEPGGEAALYGMMATLPDRKAAKALALQYLNDLYRLS